MSRLSKWVVDIHRDIEGDCEIIKKYEEPKADVLDKIRAEIMAIGNWNTKSELPNGDLEKVLDIIDKYKAESEDKK
jgi:hypothetical protein